MAINRIIALFTLKPGVEVSTYEAWAREVDLPAVNGLPSIIRFDVFKTKLILGSDAKPPYDYIEILDINDMDQFVQDVATPTMKKIAGHFQSIADVTFILTEPLLPTPAGHVD
jgi:hypothetical protein